MITLKCPVLRKHNTYSGVRDFRESGIDFRERQRETENNISLDFDIQCCLPTRFHVEMGPLDAHVVSEVHPFGEVLF